MKKKQMLSWVLSLVMALTVFSVPVSGFAEEEGASSDPADGVAAEVIAEDATEATVSDENTDGIPKEPETVPGDEEFVTEDPETTFDAGDEGFRPMAGAARKYSLVDAWDKVLTSGSTIAISDLPTVYLYVVSNESTSPHKYPKKTVWHNNSTAVTKFGYWDGEDSQATTASTLTQTEDHEIWLIPRKAGTIKLSVDVYESVSGSVVKTLNLNITVSQKEYEEIKFGEYLSDAYLTKADYDAQTVYGNLPSVEEYNKEYSVITPEISTSDFAKLKITATVDGKTYNATIDKKKYTFSAKFENVKLGTKVKVTYTMGSYSKNETIKMTKWITPKVKPKNYTYDGKKHSGAPKVTYKGKKLKKWKDYNYDSDVRKNVGRCWYYISCGDDEEEVYGVYRFNAKSGYFKINPQGTSLKKLKKGKNAITVNWKRQSKKMSKKRVTGYQIQLATNKKFTKNKKLVTVKGYKKTSKKVKKLNRNTKYYVRVRTYMKVGKYKYYSKWSKVKTMKTEKKGLKTVEMTLYDCIKDGDNVYCYSGAGIYKINIKTETKKRLVKALASDYTYAGPMALKGGYLYYVLQEGDGIGGCSIHRIKTSGKNHKRLAGDNSYKFAISGKAIYYVQDKINYDTGDSKSIKKKMRLNGTNKEKKSFIMHVHYAKTNKKGYKVIEDTANYKTKYSLKTPTKTIPIVTVTD